MARWLLPLSCALGCPLLMGGMMMAFGRDWEGAKLRREVNRINRRAGLPATNAQGMPVLTGWRRLWCSACLNWKVITALTTVAVALAIISPTLLNRFGPGLLIAVCPLSMAAAMVVMARRGRRADGAVSSAARQPPAAQVAVADRPVPPDPHELAGARDER